MNYFDPDVKIPAETIARVKSCPFCGQPPEVMTSGERSTGLMIQCITENCANPSVSYYEHELALAVWNRRNAADD